MAEKGGRSQEKLPRGRDICAELSRVWDYRRESMSQATEASQKNETHPQIIVLRWPEGRRVYGGGGGALAVKKRVSGNRRSPICGVC